MDGASLYILRCADGKLYTGLTRREVEERVSEHDQGLSTFTKTRLPVVLLFSEHYLRITDAIEAERRIKGWSRAKKLAYVAGDFERLSALAKRKKKDGGSLSLVVRDGPLGLLAMRVWGRCRGTARTLKTPAACHPPLPPRSLMVRRAKPVSNRPSKDGLWRSRDHRRCDGNPILAARAARSVDASSKRPARVMIPRGSRRPFGPPHHEGVAVWPAPFPGAAEIFHPTLSDEMPASSHSMDAPVLDDPSHLVQGISTENDAS